MKKDAISGIINDPKSTRTKRTDVLRMILVYCLAFIFEKPILKNNYFII